MTFGLIEVFLLLLLFVMFGGVFLRIGGTILYALILIVGIFFLLRVLGVLI